MSGSIGGGEEVLDWVDWDVDGLCQGGFGGG